MGDDGEVIGVEMFNANDESIARARAEEIVARHDYPAVEVWDHTAMIYRAERRSRSRSRSKQSAPTTKSS